MSIDDYEFIEFRELTNKLNGFYEIKRIEQEEKWKRTNYIAYSILINNPYVNKKDKPKSFESFLKKGDNKNKGNEITTEAELLNWIN